MGDKSGIQWTDATWNPTTGCDRVSPGCANCYALTMAGRLKAMGLGAYQRDGDPRTSGPGFGLTLHEDRLDQPLRWKRPRRIFVDSMSDLFHPDVDDRFLDRVFAVMALAPQHIFQVLTKRPERMREYLTAPLPAIRGGMFDGLGGTQRVVIGAAMDYYLPALAAAGGFPTAWPLPNVWLGTSVENARWRTRIDELRKTPAAVRFLSCEPLLGPLVGLVAGDPEEGTYFDLTGIDWVIVGGESGPGARYMNEWWVRDIVRESRRQGAAPYVKQMGSVWAEARGLGRSHGGNIETFPADLQVREYPR